MSINLNKGYDNNTTEERGPTKSLGLQIDDNLTEKKSTLNILSPD
jgi:hypothetical protein